MAEQSLVVLFLLLRLVRLAERAVAVAGTAQETSLLLVLRGGRRQVRSLDVDQNQELRATMREVK